MQCRRVFSDVSTSSQQSRARSPPALRRTRVCRSASPPPPWERASSTAWRCRQVDVVALSIFSKSWSPLRVNGGRLLPRALDGRLRLQGVLLDEVANRRHLHSLHLRENPPALHSRARRSRSAPAARSRACRTGRRPSTARHSTVRRRPQCSTAATLAPASALRKRSRREKPL